jgi:hypothetical protein
MAHVGDQMDGMEMGVQMLQLATIMLFNKMSHLILLSLKWEKENDI